MNTTPNASYSFTLRLEIPNRVGVLSQVMNAISEAGGDLGAIDIVQATREFMVRDVTVSAGDEAHSQLIVEQVKALPEVRVINFSDRTFLLHLGGKISIQSKIPLRTRDQLSMAYTPGVTRICEAIVADKSKVYSLTIKSNTVAIISDGSAVPGLGNIGPEAALPMIEAKAMLFREFGQVDAFPIVLATQDTEEIIQHVKAIAPAFGAIVLEAIAAPRCFEIEQRLTEELSIPVLHDGQHGTAVVVLAALLNALKVTDKKINEVKVVMGGVGAGGIAASKILMDAGVQHIVGVDRAGLLYKGRPDNMNQNKTWYAENTNPQNERGSLLDGLRGADVFIGLSGPGTLTVEGLKQMNPSPIVFALASPLPEIWPEQAAPYVKVLATGRSDYPNQIDTVLFFPGFFRGVLDCRASRINQAMKLAAARAIQTILTDEEVGPDYIIPSVFDKRVVTSVARAVVEAAYETGVARRERKHN